MNGLTVGQNLLLGGARFAGEMDLGGARSTGTSMRSARSLQVMWTSAAPRSSGQLDARGATFEARLNMNRLTVGKDIFLTDGARFAGEVDLGGAKVDGQLNASGATFEAA